MKLDFSISEFIIDGISITPDVADKILKYHIKVVQPIRDKIGCAIWPSGHSGYRPLLWETTHGRSGTSQHVFRDKGAVDWTCRNKWQLELLFEELKKSDYMRVCYYPKHGFIHADYKGKDKKSYVCYDGVKWRVQKKE